MKVTMSRRFLILVFAALAAPFALGRQSQPAPSQENRETVRSATARPSSQLIVKGKLLGQEVPPRPGEICVVCKRRIGTEGVVYLVKGQRVPLHIHSCYEKFRKNPLPYLAALQPHGAFLGAGGEGQRLSWGWFLGGLYVLVGLIFAALSAHRAVNSGRSAGTWFAAGLALNAFGYLLLLTRSRQPAQGPEGLAGVLGKVPVTARPLPCSHCGRMNHPSAERCADCGGQLHPSLTSEVEKTGMHKR
jgi:hypothetical protein